MPDLNAIVEVIAKHLPPSADRVRICALDAPARAWAGALAAAHFVGVVDTGECDATLASRLRSIAPVKLRPGGRAIFLLADERRSLSEVAAIMQHAGFTRILTESVLDGAFILARGEPIAAASPDRNAEAARLGEGLRVAQAGDPLPRYLHLLVHQEPPSRGWEQPDLQSVTWHAATVRDMAQDRSVLLGFSSLVKAVAFMKPAVLAGAIPDINRLPRYRGEQVAGWGMAVLLNPAFEVLHVDPHFTFDATPLRIDPQSEEKLRE
jgi:hypothetical protein